MKLMGYAVLVYGLYLGVMVLTQRHILFPASLAVPVEASSETYRNLEKMWLELSFGRVETWLLKPDSDRFAGKRPAVIFAHGNAELIDHWAGFLQHFPRRGIAVCLVEYPGYGRSQGNPSQGSIRETVIAAFDTLTSRQDIDSAGIILMGRSLGGAAVCLLSKDRPSSGLILLSTFTSVRDMARKYLVPSFLVRDPLDNLSAVSRYGGPVMVIHGLYDEVIPYTHGRRLAEASPQAILVSYPCGHNDFPHDETVFWKDIGSFLQTLSIGLAGEVFSDPE
jgi:hypothetical protein